MNMKRIVKIYKKFVLVVSVAIATIATSCTDYLTIIPPNVVVQENFWHTKDEVNGMLATSYIKLISTDAIQKAIVWGELRADNMTYPANYNRDIKYIVEASILDENSFCNWSIFYEAINNANLVIEYAPLVLDRDPDFSEGDLQVVTGEMLAMRALCHFYLVRTFRDIPLALVPAVNDSELPEYAQVHPLVALDSIMSDLNRAENMVMPSGNFTTKAHNYGRITKNAVLAMKADVNLWRAAFAAYYEGESELVQPGDVQRYYDLCVQNCQDVIANMDRKLEEEWEKHNRPQTRYPYNLLQNEGEPDDIEDTRVSTVYNQIFGFQNSEESIFELQITDDNSTNGANKGIVNMYGTDGRSGTVVVPSGFLNKNYTSDDLRAFTYTNAKNLTGTGGSSSSSSSEPLDIVIAKYSAKESPATNYRKADEFDANWIIYRRTDVLLMMAEAMVARPSSSTADFTEAFNIVKAINTRSRMDTTNIVKPLQLNSYLTRDASLDLVMKERLLELTYEGKRWYDLVRKALREKSTNGILFVADKLSSNSSVVKTKMSTIDGLFFPIYINELRYNKLLKQNPAYEDEESSTEMN